MNQIKKKKIIYGINTEKDSYKDSTEHLGRLLLAEEVLEDHNLTDSNDNNGQCLSNRPEEDPLV